MVVVHVTLFSSHVSFELRIDVLPEAWQASTRDFGIEEAGCECHTRQVGRLRFLRARACCIWSPGNRSVDAVFLHTGTG